MTEIFVVTETSFQYNDEVHSVVEDDGGTPIAAFNTQTEAYTYVQKATIGFLKGWGGKNLGQFGYEMCMIFQRKPTFLSMTEEEFFQGDTWDLEKLIVVKDLSDNELEELANAIDFSPYNVTEVSVGQAV